MREWLDRLNLVLLIVVALATLCLMILFVHFTYAFHSFLWKSISVSVAIIFSFLFLLVTTAALNKTSFAKKKVRGLYLALAYLIVIAIYFVSSYLIGSIEVLLLLPLSTLVLYWTYIRENFIETKQNDDEQLKSHLEGIRSYLHRQVNFMLTLVFALTVLALLLIKGILPVPTTFGALYVVGLTVYTVIFSVVTAFGVLGLGRDRANPLNSAIRRPLLGLAHMCITFFLVSLVGTVLGADVDASLFTTATTLGKAFSWETLGVGVIRIWLIESVIISFPFTLVYLYAILRTFLLGSTSEPGDP